MFSCETLWCKLGSGEEGKGGLERAAASLTDTHTRTISALLSRAALYSGVQSPLSGPCSHPGVGVLRASRQEERSLPSFGSW